MQRFLFSWRHAVTSEFGPKHPSDRLVALTISLYFNGDGLGAWPSQNTLATRTGLSSKSVGKAIRRLEKAEWLSRLARKGPRGIRAPRWGFEYRAKLPKKMSNALANGEDSSLFSGKEPRAAAPQKNRELRDHRIGNVVPTNTSREYVKGAALKRGMIPTPQELDAFVADLDAAEGLAKTAAAR